MTDKIASNIGLFDEEDANDSHPTVDATSPKPRGNNLDGKDWTRFSISVWSDLRKTPEEVALHHPAMFPLALATRLISIFTNEQQSVIFDPFAGTGTTPLAAQQLGKHGIGIELSPVYAELAKKRFEQLTLFGTGQGSATLHIADARDMLAHVAPQSVDFTITSPPYWDVLTQKRSADYKEIRDYGDEHADLGKISDYRAFLDELKTVFEKVYSASRPGAYCCVIVMDLRKGSRFYPFHSDIANFMQDIGFLYDDLIIWDRRHEYNNMRPLGYPYVFRVNKAHEFILIFQKPKNA
jgi:DNA modification methylase